MNECVGV
jgi:hypothetical protein